MSLTQQLAAPAAQLAAEGAGEHRTLIITLFSVFVAITLGVTVWAGRRTKDATDFYAGGRQFSGFQNGLAISGDYMSAASFLGIAGAIALSGYDGFLYSIGFLVAWLVALLLVAEPLRNSGRYTMGDVLAYRMRQRPVRTAAGVSTIIVSIFYLLAQMVGAGALVALLLGITGETGKNLIVVFVGIVMILYVTVGGMKGTTWVQMIKACLLIGGTVVITVLVFHKFNYNLSALLGAAAENSGKGASFLEPGLKYGVSTTSRIDFISLGIALVLGTAGLPHILIRFYTVPTAKAARKSVNWAIGIIGVFYLMTIALGFGAAALLSRQTITDSNAAGNTAAPLLAQEIGGGADSTGGAVLLAMISAVAFATILAVVAGLTLASSSSFAHDLYANVIRRGKATEKEEVKAARAGLGGHHRRRRHRPGNLRWQAQRRRARRPRLRGRRLREPAHAPLQPLLEALHHHGCAVVDLRRARLLRGPGVLLAGGHRQGDLHVPRRRLRLVPAAESRPHLHSAGLPARLDRFPPLQGRGRRRRQVRGARGSLHDRSRRPLTAGAPLAGAPPPPDTTSRRQPKDDDGGVPPQPDAPRDGGNRPREDAPREGSRGCGGRRGSALAGATPQQRKLSDVTYVTYAAKQITHLGGPSACCSTPMGGSPPTCASR